MPHPTNPSPPPLPCSIHKKNMNSKILLVLSLLSIVQAFIAPLSTHTRPTFLLSTPTPTPASDATETTPSTTPPSTTSGPPKVTMRKRKPAVVVASPTDSTDADSAAPVIVVKKTSKRSFTIQSNFEGNGGHFIDISVQNFDKSSLHTVIISKEWLSELITLAGGATCTAETLTKYIMFYLLDNGMKIDNTEGMIDAAAFPINYFSARQVKYFYEGVEETLADWIKEGKEV